MTPDNRLLISVVVPTYRRITLLRRCLDALLAQEIDATAFEIIVVDDGRENAVRDLVAQFEEQSRTLRVRYLRPSHRLGPAGARNHGWRVARGELIAFTDDDTVATRGWLAAAARCAKSNPLWVAFSGRVVVPPTDPARPPSDHERMTHGLSTAEFVTANAFVRREALQAAHGFDERFTRAWREDADLQFRLLALGVVGHCREAVVFHPVRSESWGVSLRQQRNIYFDALLYKKHPRLYRERIRRVPPWDYYAIVAFSLVAPSLWAAGQRRAAVLGIATATALVLRFAWVRLRGTDRSPQHLLEMLATSALIPFLSVYWRVRGALRFRVLFL